MYSDSGFATHAKSQVHINAMLAWRNYKTKGPEETLINTLSHSVEELVKENRHYIRSVA